MIIFLQVRSGNQEIAPLPPDRVLESPPFSISGLDFAGPFFIKDSDKKHYLLLFTCATTRALHLELLPSMSTEQFLLAFRRFISRRGLCSTIYSDNAKTFKRAELELKNFWRCMLHPSVQDLFSTHGITWKYIVEKGAWWGGFWERHFRTIKTCLRKIIGRSSLSLNELETVFVEIEAMINSRPIYDDPSEPSPLTPAHFLIGKRLLSLPVTRVSREDLTGSRLSLLKRYRHQQNLLNQFWNRWRKHYLLSLRSMNICPPSKVTCQFKVDDVVLIHDDRFPRNLWSMGKIIETYTGRDGKIRSCLVKTKNNAIRRPVQLLYNLEV
ncbi:integrase catalytic domain-containing protein [Trichonephila clavata]|uniref:Integrase catalytic domain-containing protein n=1 Tax=Trichonephila clavata TaxID=2740835 RepID=A0A8X6LFM4_TRICU|nr:integrase catalytic domain-containing protein [Trichonephila clavata]